MCFRARIINISHFGLHAPTSITISNVETFVPITILSTSIADVASIIIVIPTLITLPTYIITITNCVTITSNCKLT